MSTATSGRERPRQRPILHERVAGEGELFHDLAADEVLLDDAFEHVRTGRVIPDTLRVDQRDRAAFADAETVYLGAVHAIE